MNRIAAVTTGNEEERASSKSRMVTTLLVFFLGIFGAHRFYLGKKVTAVVMLLLAIFGIVSYVFSLTLLHDSAFSIWVGIAILAGLASLLAVSIWALIDFILVVSGRMKDENGGIIKRWKQRGN
jgi:TM2 domain-containing membrane protein YozV